MATRRGQVERQYYLAHSSGYTAQTPYATLQRGYFTQYIIANEAGAVASQVQRQPLDELEPRWAKAWITNNGGTPPTKNYLGSLYRQMVAILSKPVSRYMNDNIYTFFSSAA